MIKTRHPAKFSDHFLPEFASILRDRKRVIDIFSGVGKLGYIVNYGFKGDIYLNELEYEWACQSPNWCTVTVGDSSNLPYPNDFFDSACASPTYANRMGDHHNAKDKSRRNTYTHSIGRKLTTGNTGEMQWSGRKKKQYCIKSKQVYIELKRVLCDGALFVLNMSDHIRRGKRIRVTLWHILCLKSLGFELLEHRKVSTKRLRHGENGDKRVDYESILIFKLNKNLVNGRDLL